MSRERARNFADRLTPVVPKEETDISHLSDEMADILYPGRRRRPFRMGVAFDGWDGPDYERALSLARRSPLYRETPAHGHPRHETAFDVDGAGTLRDLFGIVGPRANTDVLVDGRRVPYAREIWLPFFYMFVGEA